jgi:hypothetical protein
MRQGDTEIELQNTAPVVEILRPHRLVQAVERAVGRRDPRDVAHLAAGRGRKLRKLILNGIAGHQARDQEVDADGQENDQQHHAEALCEVAEIHAYFVGFRWCTTRLNPSHGMNGLM